MPIRTLLRGAARAHKKLTDWARQVLLPLKRWLPEHAVVVVADSGIAALELLDAARREVTLITRLRLDAALYEPAPARLPRQNGRPRKKGARLPTLQQVLDSERTCWTEVAVVSRYGDEAERVVEVASGAAVWYHTGLPPVPIRWVLVRDPLSEFTPQALLSTDLSAAPAQVLAWFVRRWAVEVTFEEARARLGVETQRQWSDKAVGRTTPAVLALFSLVAVVAHRQPARDRSLVAQQAAWYVKARPTFADALAMVRRQLWRETAFHTPRYKPDVVKVERAVFERLTETLCYAA